MTTAWSRLDHSTQHCHVTWLDSSHVHVNVLGHTPTPFLSVESCYLRLFPGESHSSQIFLDYIPLQFVLGRPGPLLKPKTSQYSAWCVMRRWSIRIVWPSLRSLLPLRVFRMLCCPVLALTSSFVTLSFQETPNMLLSHLCWAASSRFDNVTCKQEKYLITHLHAWSIAMEYAKNYEIRSKIIWNIWTKTSGTFCGQCNLRLLSTKVLQGSVATLSLIHIWRCRRSYACRSRWSPYH